MLRKLVALEIIFEIFRRESAPIDNIVLRFIGVKRGVMSNQTPVCTRNLTTSGWSSGTNMGVLSVNGPSTTSSRPNQRVAHRYAYFAFPCGFSLRVRDEKHRNAARIWEDPRRNANYPYLHATPLLPKSIRCRGQFRCMKFQTAPRPDGGSS